MFYGALEKMRNISCRFYRNIFALSLLSLFVGQPLLCFGSHKKGKEFLAQNLGALAFDFWFEVRLIFGSYYV
jgi:hypothetical protein